MLFRSLTVDELVDAMLESGGAGNRDEVIRAITRVESIVGATLPTPNEIIAMGFRQLYTQKGCSGVARSLLADHLVRKYHLKNIWSRSASAQELYGYRDGYYQEDQGHIQSTIRKIMGVLFSRQILNEVLAHIKGHEDVNCEREDFLPNPRYINLRNGIYDLTTNQLLPHDPKYLFLHQLPVTYNPQADCPLFNKFVGEMLSREHGLLLEELFGYCLYRKYAFKKAFIFVGEADTGKSTMLKVLDAFIGKPNISGVDLQTLGHNRFAAAALYQKLLNYFDDLEAEHLESVAQIKIACGGGEMSAERKFGEMFMFHNFAKLVFSCNTVPEPKSDRNLTDDAFFGRWCILPFNNKITVENMDYDLADKLNTKVELSGILNLAIKRLKEILERGNLSYNLDVDEIREEMLRSGSPISQFSYDALERSDNEEEYITKELMYRTFAKYVRDNDLPATSKDELGKQLSKLCKFITTSTRRDGKERVWRGAVIKKEYQLPTKEAEGIIALTKKKQSYPMHGKSHECEYAIIKGIERCRLCGEFAVFEKI